MSSRFLLLALFTATPVRAANPLNLRSPDNVYSLEMVHSPVPGADLSINSDTLQLSRGGRAIAKESTFGYLMGAYWRADGRYVAVNNRRANSGDYLWIFELPSGKVVKKPDDSIAKTLEMAGTRSINAGFPNTHNKETNHQFLTAEGWGNGQLRFVFAENFFGVDGEFFLHGSTDPVSWIVTNPKLTSRGAAESTQVPRAGEPIGPEQMPGPGSAPVSQPVTETKKAQLTTLVEFTGNGATNKGGEPNGLILASDGNFYGTTERGGANGYGTVFKMTPAGVLTTLVEFTGNRGTTNRGGYSSAPLLQGKDGKFYGTTSGGGGAATYGTIFTMTPTGVLTTLVEFSKNDPAQKGYEPYAGLVQGRDGSFYGTTFAGGSGIFGTVFKITPEGAYSRLVDFSANLTRGKGLSPWAGLLLAKDGNFYGTTWGGLGVGGTVFKMSPAGALTTLVRFSATKPPNKGTGPMAELVQGGDGNFYGTTPVGGSYNNGTIFKVTSRGALTTLVEFAENDNKKGAQPKAGLVEDSDGNFYGATTIGGANGWGTIFKMTPAGSFATLLDFTNTTGACKGRGMHAALVRGSDGAYYGTTAWGGTNDVGTVFRLSMTKEGASSSVSPPNSSPKPQNLRAAQTAKEEDKQAAPPGQRPTSSGHFASAISGRIPEYSAAEGRKHIGEKATIIGKVECVSAGRTFHVLELDGCSPKSPLWIIVNDDASGPDLNVNELKGVTIAVSGKIEKPQTQPWLVVKSTTQIVPRTKLNPDYLGRARQKEQQGDLDGAIAEVGQAVEHQPDRRKEAYDFLAEAKEKKGDWDGALAAYDDLVRLDPNDSGSYWVRATAKEHHGDFEGAMADFTRAAELRSSGTGYIEIGNFRKARGDLAGAEANYDKAIALLDAQITRAPEALLYYQRGYAKELKDDLDGAVSDYSRAIGMNPSYQAVAYSRRGDIKKARGNLAGAIDDYEHAVKYAQLDEDKEKLKKARAELRGGHAVAGAAGQKLSDTQIKEKLIGYWESPRHGYLIESDGIIYMLPRKYASTTNRWDVKDGLFYWDGLPHDIITLSDKKCVYRSRGRNPATFTLLRSTKEEADPE